MTERLYPGAMSPDDAEPAITRNEAASIATDIDTNPPPWRTDPHPGDRPRLTTLGDLYAIVAPSTYPGSDEPRRDMTDRERHRADAAAGIDVIFQAMPCTHPGCPTLAGYFYGPEARYPADAAAARCPDHTDPDPDPARPPSPREGSDGGG